MNTAIGKKLKINEVTEMGKNREADKTKNNKVGVKDEIGLEDVEKASREAIENELKNFEEQRKRAIEGKKNYEEQWNVDDQLYNIILEKPAKKEEKRTFEYEDDPKYWELRKKQLEFKYRQDKYMADAKIKQFDTQIEKMQEQIDSAKEALKDFDEEGKNE